MIVEGLQKIQKDMIRPVLIVILVLIALFAMLTTGFGKVDSLWIVFPLSGIRISTLVTALTCFAIVLFLQRKNTL